MGHSKDGKSLDRICKNATKMGFYWVFATVYPTITTEGSKDIYLVEEKLQRKEIERAENLYKTLK